MASHAKTYEKFLSAPKEEYLSPEASLAYITTALTYKGAASVVKQLKKQEVDFSRRDDKQLNVVEAGSTLVVETETTIEFQENGGAFLPGIDDNFVSERTVVFPIVHVVEFRDGKINQMRLYWDQSTLLKQVGLIGRAGVNWPIKDGREQSRIISTVISNIPEASAADKQGSGANTTPKRANGYVPPLKDPHASLDLFSPKREEEKPIVIAPKRKTGYQPPQRNLEDIIGEPDEGEVPAPPSPTKKRSGSGTSSRAGFAAPASFEFGHGDEEPIRPVIGRKSKPRGNGNFLFDEDAEVEEIPQPKFKPRNPKHNSSWSFEQFNTPERTAVRHRPTDERNFSLSDNEEEGMETPVKPTRKPIPRATDDVHFSITDDPSDNEAPAPKPSKNGLSDATNLQRGIGGSQFQISDASPANGNIKKEISNDRKAAVKMMDPNFSLFNSPSPAQPSTFDAENRQPGRNKMETQNWTFGESPTPAKPAAKNTGRGHGQRHGKSDFWDF